MVLDKTKWIKLAAVACFAILQALQPFIHAHLDAEHPIQNTGFHIGNEHEAHVNASGHLTGHSVSDVSHASHAVVSVATGIKQDIDPALLIDAISFVLLCLCFAIVIQSVSNRFPQLTPVNHKSLKRRLPASRAPPQS